MVKLWATTNGAKTIEGLKPAPKLTPEQLSPQELARLLPPDAVHQGLIADVAPLPEITLETIMARGRPIIVLDQIVDPRNVGAILRAAAVFGAAGIIVTRHHSPRAEGALAKTASGALEIVPIVAVANLARTLSMLADAGFWCWGLMSTAAEPLTRLTQTSLWLALWVPKVRFAPAYARDLHRTRAPAHRRGGRRHANEFVTLNDGDRRRHHALA